MMEATAAWLVIICFISGFLMAYKCYKIEDEWFNGFLLAILGFVAGFALVFLAALFLCLLIVAIGAVL